MENEVYQRLQGANADCRNTLLDCSPCADLRYFNDFCVLNENGIGDVRVVVMNREQYKESAKKCVKVICQNAGRLSRLKGYGLLAYFRYSIELKPGS